jgi:ubiquinone/menaquinone biosynthesis C-methylase UbiE
MSIRTKIVCICIYAYLAELSAAVAADNQVQGHHHHSHSKSGFHKSFQNAQEWAKKFEDPARDAWQKPDEVVSALKLQSADKIADIGAGTGYFAWRLAKAIPQGRVYAVDVEKDMIDYLKEVGTKKNLSNLIPIHGTATDPKLPEKVNVALVVDTYHHIDSRPEYFRQLRQSLLPDARLVIIDFHEKSEEGPPPEHRLRKEEVISELKEAGYQLEDTLHFLPNQYFLIFR